MSKIVLNQNLDFGMNLGVPGVGFWSWFMKHKEDVILHVGFWLIKFDVKVKELEPLFERIFGQNPLD